MFLHAQADLIHHLECRAAASGADAGAALPVPFLGVAFPEKDAPALPDGLARAQAGYNPPRVFLPNNWGCHMAGICPHAAWGSVAARQPSAAYTWMHPGGFLGDVLAAWPHSHPSGLPFPPLGKDEKGFALLARTPTTQRGSAPSAANWLANLFRRGGEDALLQPEGLCGQRAPELVPRQAGLELRKARGHEQLAMAGPVPPGPGPPNLVHGLLRLLGVAAVRLRHVAHRQGHHLEGVVPARQRGGERGLPDPLSASRGSSLLCVSPQM